MFLTFKFFMLPATCRTVSSGKTESAFFINDQSYIKQKREICISNYRIYTTMVKFMLIKLRIKNALYTAEVRINKLPRMYHQ